MPAPTETLLSRGSCSHRSRCVITRTFGSSSISKTSRCFEPSPSMRVRTLSKSKHSRSREKRTSISCEPTDLLYSQVLRLTFASIWPDGRQAKAVITGSSLADFRNRNAVVLIEKCLPDSGCCQTGFYGVNRPQTNVGVDS